MVAKLSLHFTRRISQILHQKNRAILTLFTDKSKYILTFFSFFFFSEQNVDTLQPGNPSTAPSRGYRMVNQWTEVSWKKYAQKTNPT